MNTWLRNVSKERELSAGYNRSRYGAGHFIPSRVHLPMKMPTLDGRNGATALQEIAAIGADARISSWTRASL